MTEVAQLADASPGVRIRDAAPQLGLSPRAVRRGCASGAFPGRKRGRLWFVNADWLAEITAWPREDGDAA